MFIQAIDVNFLDDVTLEVTYQDGKIIRYDMSNMFSKYPQLKVLKKNRKLFLSGHLDSGGYGIIWNDELDFDAMSIYEEGELVGKNKPTINQEIGILILKTREELGITQVELSKLTHIDQGDISKIEKGLGNPTIGKIKKIFEALGKDISIQIL